eukprot:CAMPEP_0194500186 /NCGR_PEP_ID=MMETSP0253-20130528/16837_1 /TAXON_ID=2966 /ORGANISM="Noctiluca scintillans" /LENGTH=46 /DNA_ID= /DNA_START= /DNA_END= /DNA_ORIENTATION=
MSSKISSTALFESIKVMREGTKKRNFAQTVELQLSLKDIDPTKDKR